MTESLSDVLRRIQASTAAPVSQGGFTTYNPSGQLRAANAQAQAVANPRQARLAEIIGNQGKPSGGGGGFFGTLLNNPLGRGVMGALGVIDIPRRAIMSFANEGADLLQGKGFSGSDFINQVQDKSFGFKQAVGGDVTDNGFLNGLINFAADVAFDPLTYVGLGGAKYAGKAGRTAAATRLADAGMDASRVARLGTMGATAAERDVIFAGMKGAEELAQPGLRFMGQRVEGTGRLAEVVGGGLSKTRAAISDRIPSKVHDLMAPRGLEDAYRVLRTGAGDTEDALALIARTQSAKMGGRIFGATYASEADRLAREFSSNETVDRAAFDALDGLVGTELDDVAMKGRTFFDKTHSKASESVTELPYRQHYAPHIVTEAYKDGRGAEFDAVKVAAGIDVTKTTGAAMPRRFDPGMKFEFPDGSTVTLVADTKGGAVSARQINEKIAPHLGIDKVFEDRLSKVLQPHVQSLAENVGRAEGLTRLGQLAHTAPLEDVLDQKAMKAAGAKQAKAIDREVRGVGSEQARVASQLDQGAARAKKELVTTATSQKAAAEARLATAKATEAKATRALKGLPEQSAKATREVSSSVSAAQKQLDQIANEQGALHVSSTAERAAIDVESKAQKLEHDAIVKRQRRAQASGQETPIPAGGTHKAAASEAKAALDKHVAKVEADLSARRSSALGSMAEAERKAVKQYDNLDGAREVLARAKMDAKDAAAMAASDVKDAKAALAAAKKVRTSAPKPSAAAYGKIEADLDAVAKMVGGGSSDTKTLLSWYAKGVAELRDGKVLNDGLVSLQKAVKRGEVGPIVKQVIRDGYEQIGASLVGESAPIVRKELARQLKHLDEVVAKAEFWKIVDKYTHFFKTYATSTVGFHVRNGMSAAFMNATDGVSLRHMGRGAKLWEMFERNPQGWLDELPEWVTLEEAEKALKGVFAAGGGGGQYGRAELQLGKGKITNNTYTRASQRVGERVEGYARMGMALDTVVAGGTWEEAGARISRIHFNYSEVSNLDVAAKRFIPFWTFLSRNVPLQVQQMFLRPRMYQAYASLARNMGQNYEDGMIPKSWQDVGAFKITDGVWLAPDLPHTRLMSELGKLTSDPQRLLADTNPLFKIPFETVIAKRKLFNDQPFKPNQFETTSGGGIGVIAPLLSALGLTETAGDGSQVVDEKLAYALRGLIPVLGQSQRLTGDDPYYSDKRAQSVANYLGIPLRFLTPGQQEAEARRRQRAGGYSSEEARRKALESFVP